jgi:hypothetical protein
MLAKKKASRGSCFLISYGEPGGIARRVPQVGNACRCAMSEKLVDR